MKNEELIRQYMPFAEQLAKSKKKKTNRSVYYEELEAAAYFGLVDAATRHTAEKGKFKDYAAHRIIGEMNDYLRELQWSRSNIEVGKLPVAVVAKENVSVDLILSFLPKTARELFHWKYIDCLTLRQIGERLSMGESEVSRLLKRYKERICS